MRQRAKADGNQPSITRALRDIGASVFPTHMVGHGFPDLVVGRNGRTMLLEVKDDSQPPSKQRLTEDEQVFMDTWRGHATVVKNAEEAVQAVLRCSVS